MYPELAVGLVSLISLPETTTDKLPALTFSDPKNPVKLCCPTLVSMPNPSMYPGSKSCPELKTLAIIFVTIQNFLTLAGGVK